MIKNRSSIGLLVVLLIGHASVAKAGEIIEYIGVNLNQASINIDSFGATSIDDESSGYKLLAASRLSKHFFLEYGYQDLGEYKASYDFTVGTFRFVESHSLNFSQSIFVALKARSNLGRILSENVSIHFELGAMLCQTELEMNGYLYDSGTPFAPYGASGDDISLSGYYGFGLGYRLNKRIILTLNGDIYLNVGKGVKLQHLDGSQKEYAGRDIESLGLSLSYMF